MRGRGLLPLLLIATPLAAGEARLQKTEPPPVRRTYDLPSGREATARPEARRTQVGEHELTLVDVDGDGRFDESGVDGWTLPGHRFLFPLEDRIFVGADAIQLTVVEDRVEFELEAAPDRKESRLLAAFNALRMAHGIAPLAQDEGRSRGCREHTAYMDRHGITRVQDPARDGATPAGAEAARQALVMRFLDPELVAGGIFRSFPNRIWMFHPKLGGAGIGGSDRHLTLDIAAPLVRGRRVAWPVVIPAPGSRENPTTLYRVRPQLFGGEGKGLPITLQFESAQVRDVTAEVRERNAKGKKLDVLVSWPQKPAAPAIRDNAEAICIVPREPLRPAETYFVHVSYTDRGEAGERSWTFTTAGRARKPKKDGNKPVAFKKKAPLKPYKLKRIPLFAFEPDGKPVKEPAARRAPLGRYKVLFVDLDGNGAFGDPGTDAWTLERQRYMFPVEGSFVLGEQEFEFVVEGDVVRYTDRTVPARKNYRKALIRWNEARMRNGLAPATLRHEWCVNCEKHTAYMDRHGVEAAEDPKREGYTPEGDRVGKRAALVNLGDLKRAVDVFVRRFAGRRGLFSPYAGEAGFGLGTGNAGLDARARLRDRRWTWPVMVPAPESEGHPAGNIASTPLLFPDTLRSAAEVGRTGYPITIYFEKGRADFQKVEAEIREGGRQGKKVEVLVAWPQRPAYRELRSNDHAILVLTRKPLRRRTRYEVTVRATKGEKTEVFRWWFKTGREK